jgi:hypothetical protein
MYLKKAYSQKTGRTFMSIVHKYRDPVTKIPREKLVKSLGYLDVLKAEYEDPVAHFSRVAKEMTEAAKKDDSKLTIIVDMNEQLEQGADNRKDFGYAVILWLYHQLGLDYFFNWKAQKEAFQYNPSSIAQSLIISRMLTPGSVLNTFKNKGRYFERFDFELHDCYRALKFFNDRSHDAMKYLNDQVKERFGRDTSIIYYDVTNVYMQSDHTDNLRKNGYSKENRKKPIIQIGLAMDNDGVPICYDKFPGNTNDSLTFRTVIGEVIRKYAPGRIIAVGDMDLSNDEIIEIKSGQWEIEELFRIAKSDLEIRPLFCGLEEHIGGLLFISFVSLMFERILMKLLNRKFSVAVMNECMNRVSCSLEEENVYLFDYRSEVSDDLGKLIGVDFSMKRRRLSEIKNILSQVKK